MSGDGHQLAMVALFFVYGLAFFMMGFAILGEVRWAGRSKLAASLMFLALFGLLHGLVEWTDMFLYVVRGVGATGWEEGLELAHFVLLPLSLIPLLIFGIKVLTDSVERSGVLWFLLPMLLGAWLLAGFLPLIVPSLAGEGESLADLMRWQEAWARYLLYLPGSLLAALGLASQRRMFSLIGMDNIARYATLGASAFVLNAVVAGLIVPAVPFPPATWLNHDTFVGLVGVPPQLFRALAAGVMAFSVVQMLRFFELSQRRRLEEAQQQRLQVQEETRRQAEEWSHTLEGAVQARTEQLEALAGINTEISSLLELGKILDLVVEKAHHLLGVDVVSISLLEEVTQELVVRSVAGARTPEFIGIRMAVGHGVAGKAVATGAPVAVADYATEPGITHEMDGIMAAEGLRSHLAIPLRMGERTLGAMFVASRTSREFAPQEVELLSHLAHQAAIALENARLYARAEELAVIQERERLAREIHDSLAQALGYFRLEGSQVLQHLAEGDLAAARVALERMDQMAETAYADVRDAILGLRSTVVEGRSLVPTLGDYLNTFGLQHGLKTELKAGPGVEASLSPQVEVQLIRVIQEALTNVRKHAQATRAVVSLCVEEEGVRITVEDDGRGFDPQAVARRGGSHFGLATMRERAESVGGRLEVDSAPGAGTRLSLWVPRTLTVERRPACSG